ncbi:hypothetical protein D3C78_1647080 [compost metagenome]
MHRHFAPLQPWVARQAPTAAQQQVLIVTCRQFAGLAWPYDLHLVATLSQAIAKSAERIGHAVDFGWEGFAD